MPERAEIARMAYILNTIYNNRVCNFVALLDKNKKGLYSSCELKIDQMEGYRKIDVNQKLTSVTSRGKKIIFEFNENPTLQGRFVSSCGLDGRWTLEQSKYTTIVLCFGDIYAFYEEIRIGGNFSICNYPSPQYDHIFKDVGPDLMTDETRWEIFYPILKNPKTNHWTIYNFLMEQKFLSGDGNWLTAEVLYECRINPNRLKGNLSDLDITNLYQVNKRIIIEAYEKGGLTIKDYKDPLGQEGTYETKCYGRRFDPHGNPIIKEVGRNGRKMHYCPAIQPW